MEVVSATWGTLVITLLKQKTVFPLLPECLCVTHRSQKEDKGTKSLSVAKEAESGFQVGMKELNLKCW